MTAALLERLRAADPAGRIGPPAGPAAEALLPEWDRSDVRFAASDPTLDARYWCAVRELLGCIRPMAGQRALLQEGGIYLGCWLESTGTISAELLSRFLPSVAGATFEAFAAHQREDGLLPYKLTEDGPAFAQIQLVTPPARSVWNHWRLGGGRDRGFLSRMHDALARYDAWLAAWRDTGGSGGVEAFCAYDTGHDLSPRFWHVPDSPHLNDPRACRPDHPFLPFIAPDLTAAVACQRACLAEMAEALGEDGESWRALAARSRDALFAACHDPGDHFFYDLDRHGRHVRVQSDVLLRVLACEIGDEAFFAEALRRYLLNTGKFFAKYPFTSIALDDPRFDPHFHYNSWAGPSNFLSLIRAPHAFEHHHRHVELTWAMQPALAALVRAPRFPQCLSPFTGEAGFTESYSPAILCLLDFVERLCGILPRPDGTLWFTGLVPAAVDHRDVAHETGYRRVVDGRTFELVNTPDTTTALRDGEVLFEAPGGIRVVTDRDGGIAGIVGMSARDVEGSLRTPEAELPFRVRANEQLGVVGAALASLRNPGLVLPAT
jgi:hypothetical protein